MVSIAMYEPQQSTCVAQQLTNGWNRGVEDSATLFKFLQLHSKSTALMATATFNSNDPLIVDAALAARLERTEATANSRFIEARRRISPDGKAEWIEVAGT